LVVLLTYPAWAVGPGCLRSIRLAAGLDLSGRVAAMRDVVGLLPYVKSKRKAVATSTLFEFSSLGRHPRPL
jgi:hypothetical protein